MAPRAPLRRLREDRRPPPRGPPRGLRRPRPRGRLRRRRGGRARGDGREGRAPLVRARARGPPPRAARRGRARGRGPHDVQDRRVRAPRRRHAALDAAADGPRRPPRPPRGRGGGGALRAHARGGAAGGRGLGRTPAAGGRPRGAGYFSSAPRTTTSTSHVAATDGEPTYSDVTPKSLSPSDSFVLRRAIPFAASKP